jgi:DNA repair protein RadA/Sms
MDAEYFCDKCNKGVGSRWTSRCPHCGVLNCIFKGKPTSGSSGNRWIGSGQKPRLLSDVPIEDYERISTGTREFDRVLGGGIVTGSTVLISGDPGIGKSTLLLQVAIDLSVCSMTMDENGEEKPSDPLIVLYVSAEESSSQIKGRAVRLSKESKQLFLHNESDVHEIAKHIIDIDPDILIIDSIQTMTTPGIDGAAGSVTQVRECALFLTDICKKREIGCFLVAHVTKDGAIAGPKTLEHLVDATLEFHKEGQGELRSIRTSKNRFGNTSEMALFRMTGNGLTSIENPSELLLEHHRDGLAGVCIGFAATGPRPLAVELQVILGPSSSNGSAERIQYKRLVTGLGTQRATQVIAILQRRFGLDLNREILINLPGGLEEVRDPAMDLPLALALVSYALNIALPKGFVCFGELGLAGEVRPVIYGEARVKAATLMKFTQIMGPFAPTYETGGIAEAIAQSEDVDDGSAVSQYWPVATLEEALDSLGFEIAPPLPKQAKLQRKKNKPSLHVVKDEPNLD